MVRRFFHSGIFHINDFVDRNHAHLFTTSNVIAGFVDMALVNWLLLFLSRLSDCNFDVSDPLVTSRWDFLSNESSISKRKVHLF